MDMCEASRPEVRLGLEPCLPRLWRYGLVLSGANDVAEGLVLAACRRDRARGPGEPTPSLGGEAYFPLAIGVTASARTLVLPRRPLYARSPPL
jgi:hypothetical protein